MKAKFVGREANYVIENEYEGNNCILLKYRETGTGGGLMIHYVTDIIFNTL